MAQAKPQTIYQELNDKITALADGAETFFDHQNLYIRRLYNDANKLKQANFEQGMAFLAILDCECGNLEDAIEKLQQIIKKGDAYYWASSLLLVASVRFLRPGIVAEHLDNLSTVPHSFFGEDVPSKCLTIGAYTHALKAAATLERSKIEIRDKGLPSVVIDVASHMHQSGISQDTSTAIIECAGRVLARHKIRQSGVQPIYTLHNDETCAWVKIPVTPEYAAQLDLELAEELISKGLDVEPYFVSFVGTKRA